MEINQITIDGIWESILNLKKEVNQIVDFKTDIVVCFENNKLKLGATSTSTLNQILLLKIHTDQNSKFLSDSISWEFTPKVEALPFAQFIKLYLPYVFLSVSAKLLKRAIIISHFAQTLDGKIATNSGSSKWIGNNENLLHAHRMRALCEGILIGRQTMLSDRPQLNVRHCKGDNPKKIILGRNNCKDEISKIIGDNFIEVSIEKAETGDVKSIEMDSFSGLKILQDLYKKGVQSVYLEGGSKTTSAFLKCSGLDQIQLHISPIILGSGVSNFSLPEIENISEGTHFSKFEFVNIGNTVMFLGNQTSKS